MNHNQFDKLIHELAKLPSIGEKTATRLALHILRQTPEYGHGLARALDEAITAIRFCENCLNLSNSHRCNICTDTRRDPQLICVIEDISDLIAIEATHAFKGQYHVLHGTLSPIDGIGPDDLRIPELLERIKNHDIQEIILATNPNVTGDATALYLAKLLKPFEIKTTKLASGIPVGGHIEYIDHNTLSEALSKRLEFGRV
jgi:recombination protein RecR